MSEQLSIPQKPVEHLEFDIYEEEKSMKQGLSDKQEFLDNLLALGDNELAKFLQRPGAMDAFNTAQLETLYTGVSRQKKLSKDIIACRIDLDSQHTPSWIMVLESLILADKRALTKYMRECGSIYTDQALSCICVSGDVHLVKEMCSQEKSKIDFSLSSRRNAIFTLCFEGAALHQTNLDAGLEIIEVLIKTSSWASIQDSPLGLSQAAVEKHYTELFSLASQALSKTRQFNTNEAKPRFDFSNILFEDMNAKMPNWHTQEPFMQKIVFYAVNVNATAMLEVIHRELSQKGRAEFMNQLLKKFFSEHESLSENFKEDVTHAKQWYDIRLERAMLDAKIEQSTCEQNFTGNISKNKL